MPKVRTIFQPDRPREVDEHEAAQLAREGLLLPLEPQDQAPTPTAAVTVPAATPAKEATPDGGTK